MHDDPLLAGRLSAMEGRAPAMAQPPALPDRRRRRRFAIPLAMAPVLVLAIVATTAAGAAVIGRLAEGYPGIQNPGQPLAGATMECMTPPEAMAFLAASMRVCPSGSLAFMLPEASSTSSVLCCAGAGDVASMAATMTADPINRFMVHLCLTKGLCARL